MVNNKNNKRNQHRKNNTIQRKELQTLFPLLKLKLLLSYKLHVSEFNVYEFYFISVFVTT